MSGYCSIGSVANPMKPSKTMRIEITVDSTGRFMNVVKVISIYNLTIYDLLFKFPFPTFYDLTAIVRFHNKLPNNQIAK